MHLFRLVYSLRVRADYDEARVGRRELTLLLASARSFIDEVCTDE
jgi:hypothetical protein